MRKLTFILLMSAAMSQAAPITYASLALWQAAGPQSAGTITFDGIPSFNDSALLNLNGFNFYGVGGNLIVYNPLVSWVDLGTGASLAGPVGPASIQIVLPAGVYGIAFLVGSWGGGGINAVINNDTGNPYAIPSPTLPPGPGAFWGVRNDVAISVLTLTGVSGTRVVIDTVNWGGQGEPPPPPPPEVPEVSTGLLIGASLVLLRYARRRYQRPQPV